MPLIFSIFFLIRITSYLKCSKTDKNESFFQLNNDYKTVNHNRKLDSDNKIRIFIDIPYLQNKYSNNQEEFLIIKEAIEKANKTLTNLIKIKTTRLRSIDFTGIPTSDLSEFNVNERYNGKIEGYDLVIFIRLKGDFDNEFKDGRNAFPKIVKQDGNKRPIVGIIIFDRYILYNDNNNILKENYYYFFLHEMTHILGFDIKILKNLGVVVEDRVKSRVKKNNNDVYVTKNITKRPKIIDKAKKYYKCNEITYIEFAEYKKSEDLPGSHWEPRLLLGDYMTPDIYYLEQVISELTLALIEETGFYEVNYYTGGLMRFGKHQGCDFLKKDCASKDNQNNVISLFPNEFCSYDSVGTCSSGRLSRGYCYNSFTGIKDTSNYKRDWQKYGKDFIEYCPISFDIKIDGESNYYKGSCKSNDNNFGEDLGFGNNYKDFSKYFGEKFGSNSFCALSSLIRNDSPGYTYKEYVRPICYSMICSEKSLTIMLNHNDPKYVEYIVCPRGGGLIKVGGDYTYYSGYLFCPDYYLICTSTIMCNDLYDCVEKKSIYITKEYDYSVNSISGSEITEKYKTNTKLSQYDSVQVQGYELSEDSGTACPINCRQCISNKRCTLCRDFSLSEPHAYYIGSIDDDNHSITCSSSKPTKGYYEVKRYGHFHYFKCSLGCDECKKAEECDKCAPEYKMNSKACVERIPHCKVYDESTLYDDYDTNGGGKGYELCKQCDNANGYYCVNMNKKECIKIDDNNLEKYYKMEDGEFPCVGLCDTLFPNCLKCNKNGCLICKPDYAINKENHGCSPRIPNCKRYNFSSAFIDKDNGYGESYRSCLECEQYYYCVKDNKSKCEYIDPNYSKNYYTKRNGCIEECKIKFSDCLECYEERCTKCITIIRQDGKCVKGIDNCKTYDTDNANDTYIECLECDNEHGYYCINNVKTECKYINVDLYYEIETKAYPCVKKCSDIFPHCASCTSSVCITCQRFFFLDEEKKCIIKPPENDVCDVLIHDIDLDMNDNFEFSYFMDYYFENTLPYTKIVEHFANEKYTATMFLHSECTEDLLNRGYYKIDSTQLYNKMFEELKNEMNFDFYLFSVFISYNYHNYYSFYLDDYTYVDPEQICPSCLKMTYDITNKYIRNINNALGFFVGSLVESEHLNIFSKDTELFNDICNNITIESIDIPLTVRIQLFNLHDFSTQIACGGINCVIKEINIEESTCICTCKFDLKFEDILEPIIEFKNYDEKNQNNQSSYGSFGAIGTMKCIKNGFNAKNIAANGGFIINIIAMASEIGLYMSYYFCGKVISIEKGSSPPQKIKKKIIIYNDWIKSLNKPPVNKNDINNNLIQPRDEDDQDMLEEIISFSNRKDLNVSIDTSYNPKEDKSNTNFISRLSEKNSRRILVLIPDVRKETKSDEKKKNNKFIEPGIIYSDKTKKITLKNFCQLYWSILSLKQHIINLFSSEKFHTITDSFIPIQIRLMRSIFIFILALILNILFLNQNYFSQKFHYFNEKYKIVAIKTAQYDIKGENTDDGRISSGKTLGYAFTHLFLNAFIVFIILIAIKFIICYIFFSLRKKILYIVNKNDLNEIKDLVKNTKFKYLIFFIITMTLLILFFFLFVGFGAAYGGGFGDYLIAGIISIFFLEIFPFLWSLILTFLLIYGVKKENKYCYEISRFFIF